MRTILITGGSRGIGAALVRKFAGAGDRVYFTYLRAEAEARALAEETGAEAARADAASGEQMEQVIRRIEEETGGIDEVICNAGVSLVKMLMDTTDGEYRRVMDTNVFGPFCALRAALPGMFWRRSGCAVLVSSVWGQTGASCEAVYSASKAAVIGLTQAMAREAAGAGIRVNCVAPGLIDTEMNAHLTGEDLAELEEEIPLGRMGKPEEVAEAAFFLCSGAASYITGQVLAVNGGWR